MPSCLSEPRRDRFEPQIGTPCWLRASDDISLLILSRILFRSTGIKESLSSSSDGRELSPFSLSLSLYCLLILALRRCCCCRQGMQPDWSYASKTYKLRPHDVAVVARSIDVALIKHKMAASPPHPWNLFFIIIIIIALILDSRKWTWKSGNGR